MLCTESRRTVPIPGKKITRVQEDFQPDTLVGAFEDFCKILNSDLTVKNPRVFRSLLRGNSNPKTCGDLIKVKKLVEGLRIPRVLYHQYVNRRSVTRSQQRNPKSIYQFVQQTLDGWIRSRTKQLPTEKQFTLNRKDSIYQKIVQSVELWFFQGLCNYCEGKRWLSQTTDNLLSNAIKYSSSDVVNKLINLEGAENMDEVFKNSLKNFKASNGLSKEMADFFNKHSKKYRVIADRIKGVWDRYAMHFYFTNHYTDETHTELNYELIGRVREEASFVRNTQWHNNFTVLEPTADSIPEDGSFTQLAGWLMGQLNKIKDRCSLLFLSFSLHGLKGLIIDGKKTPRSIVHLLKWLDGVEWLKEVPKVVVIEACQHIPSKVWNDEPMEEGELPPGYPSKTEDYDARSKQFIRFVEDKSSNLTLLMAVEPGVWYKGEHPLYLQQFFRIMKNGRYKTIDDIHDMVQKGKIRDPDRTKFKSSDAKKVVLRWRSKSKK